MTEPLRIAATLRWGVSGTGSALLLVLLVLVGVWVAVIAYRSTQPSLSPGPRVLLTCLRVAVFGLVVAMLAQPILHNRREVEIPPGVLLLVDDSASMSIVGESGRSRLDDAWQGRAAIVDELGGRGGTTQVWAGQGSRRLVHSVPASQLGARPGGQQEGTDLPGLLISAAQRHLEDNLQAIVLFSDGVSTVRDQPTLRGLGVPVYPVPMGDAVGPIDLRLDHVRYPTLAYRGETVRIEGEVVAQATTAGTTLAILSSEGAPVDSVAVRWPEGGGRVPFSFDVTADSLGLRVHEIHVVPHAEEPLEENNRMMTGFEVRKDRLRIAYVESRPTWNFHFLNRLAASDRRFEFIGIHRGPAGWKVAGSDTTWTLPRRPADVVDIDLWVAGSLPDLNQLSATVVVPDAVRAGSGLLVLPGEPRRGMIPALSSPSADLVPLSIAPVSRWRLARYTFSATAVGRGHPILTLPEMADLRQALDQLPPLWGVIGSPQTKDDADVLMVAARSGHSIPLLTVRDEGAGRVAMWSGGPLWSWSFWRLGAAESEDVFRSLFGNLLYYLAEGGDRTRLRLILPQQVMAQGQDAVIRGLALDPRMQPDESHDVWLEWSPGPVNEDPYREPSGRARMALDPDTPGGRRIGLPALPEGPYAVRLALEEGEDRVVSDWVDLVMDPFSVEYQTPQTDRAALQRIATATGGRVLESDQLRSFTRGLELVEEHAVLTARIDLWGSLWLFGPLLALLSIEWGLRKRWGLI